MFGAHCLRIRRNEEGKVHGTFSGDDTAAHGMHDAPFIGIYGESDLSTRIRQCLTTLHRRTRMVYERRSRIGGTTGIFWAVTVAKSGGDPTNSGAHALDLD